MVEVNGKEVDEGDANESEVPLELVEEKDEHLAASLTAGKRSANATLTSIVPLLL